MSKHVPWLREQLEAWVTDGIVSLEQANRIRARYPAPQAAVPWGTIIFSGLGAVLLGLGIILLLAYNWNAIPKGAKLALIFLSIAAAHAGGIALSRREDWGRPLGEALSVLGSMLFGAGIWLVAQIYHIDEHFPNGFLVWGLGALVMAWAFPSPAQAILAAILLCIWNGTEAWGFNLAKHWGSALILFGAGGLAWWRRSPVVLFVVLASFVVSLIANITALPQSVGFPAVICLSALFIALSVLLPRHGVFPESRAIWAFFGWTGFLICIYALSFHDAVDDLLDWRRRAATRSAVPAAFYLWGSFVAALVAWVAVALPTLRDGRGRKLPADCPLEYWLIPLSTAVCIAFSMTDVRELGFVAAGIFNLVLLALAATWMARGCRHAELRPTVLGSLLLAALAAGRYFDLFDSLALRGAVFVLVGALLFAEGILYSRARRRARKGVSP